MNCVITIKLSDSAKITQTYELGSMRIFRDNSLKF